MFQLSKINIFPIKSLGGIPLQEATLTTRGLQYDRRWMLVVDNHQFITQRAYPKMALLHPELTSEGITIHHTKSKVAPLVFPYKPQTTEKLTVRIWKSLCEAIVVSQDADKWFSEALGADCRLVYMPDYSRRPVNEKYDRGGDIVSFADGYPYMMIGQAAFDDLNTRLPEPIPMNRFRPNFVFTGGTAYEDDQWQKISIGNHTFDMTKPCTRCQIPTINQATAKMGKEPMKTLATYRRIGNDVNFGQSMVGPSSGTVKIGDEIVVLKKRTHAITYA